MDLKGLRKELKAAGVFEHRETATWLKILALFVVLVACLTVHIIGGPWAWFLVPFTALSMTCIAMHGHEGGHKAFSKSGPRNSLMLHMGFPFFAGLSAMYWKHKHNVQHHAHPNVVDEDPDIMLWPMASTRDEYERSGPGRKWFQRNLQGVMFWPLTLFLAWSMRTSTVLFLIDYARTKGVDKKWALDVGCLVSHYVLWLVVPSFFIEWYFVALFYVAAWSIVGSYLAAIFIPAHVGLPIVTEHYDTWRLQFDTTRNLSLPKGTRWFFVGLDYQLEHHLFPKIPHQNMHKASAIIQTWAKKEGVPYHQLPYFKGLINATRFMNNAWDYKPQPVHAPGLESIETPELQQVIKPAPVEPSAPLTGSTESASPA